MCALFSRSNLSQFESTTYSTRRCIRKTPRCVDAFSVCMTVCFLFIKSWAVLDMRNVIIKVQDWWLPISMSQTTGHEDNADGRVFVYTVELLVEYNCWLESPNFSQFVTSFSSFIQSAVQKHWWVAVVNKTCIDLFAQPFLVITYVIGGLWHRILFIGFQLMQSRVIGGLGNNSKFICTLSSKRWMQRLISNGDSWWMNWYLRQL